MGHSYSTTNEPSSPTSGGGSSSPASSSSSSSPLDNAVAAIAHRIHHRFCHHKCGNGGGGKRVSEAEASSTSSSLIVMANAAALFDDLTDAFDLGYPDVDYIQRAWPTIEHHILPVGIKVFVSVLDAKKSTACKRQCCCGSKAASAKRESSGKAASPSARCCPSQAIVNEELQKFFLVFVGLLRKTIKHLATPRACVNIVRKASKRQLRDIKVDVARIDDEAVIVHFCAALREVNSGYWTPVTEAAYATLISLIFLSIRRLRDVVDDDTAEATTDSEADDDSDDFTTDDNSSLHSLSAETSAQDGFASPLIAFGCQTFQEFFELHPEAANLFDVFRSVQVHERLSVSDALRTHASRALALVDEIVRCGRSGKQEKIRDILKELGRQQSQDGLTEEHLDMLGPVVCHVVRPLVFKSGLWSVELEKSWNRLFDAMATAMKAGYAPPQPQTIEGRRKKLAVVTKIADPELDFPTLTHVIMLRDTWAGITQQMNDLGLAAAVKLFKINYNLRFNSSVAKARYRNVPAPPPVVRNAEENMEHFGVIFNMLLSIIDHIISTLPNSTAAAKQSKRGSKGGSVAFSPSVATLKQLEMLREPMDWVGQVFCNTVRPLLLIQGKWSYQVEMSWKLLFRHLVKKNKREDDDDDDA